MNSKYNTLTSRNKLKTLLLVSFQYLHERKRIILIYEMSSSSYALSLRSMTLTCMSVGAWWA